MNDYAGYRRLAYGVLRQAVQDYYQSRCQGIKNDNCLFDIDPIWFEYTGVNADWFFKVVLEEGDRRYGNKLSKYAKVHKNGQMGQI